MEGICAIIDAQGFVVNGQFKPREIAIAPMDGDITSIEVDPVLDYDDLSTTDQLLNGYIENLLIGMPFRPIDMDIVLFDGNVFIAMLYEKHKTDDKPYFGIKNRQMGKLLDKLGIPYMNINAPPFDKLQRYYGEYGVCDRHFINQNCSEAKVKLLYEWMNDKEIFDKFMK